MEREVSNGHVSGKNISPFIIGNFSGEILESYSLYMKGTVLYSKITVLIPLNIQQLNGSLFGLSSNFWLRPISLLSLPEFWIGIAFDKKTEELTKLKKSEKFCNFLTSQLLNEKCNGQPIDALLIRPIQRIPSLLLLYKGNFKLIVFS